MSVSDKANTLRAQDHGHPPVVCFEPGIAKREGGADRFVTDKCTTPRANMGDNQPAVCYAIDSHPEDSRFKIDGEATSTLTSKIAKGSADGPLLLINLKHFPIENHPQDSRVKLSTDGIVQTLPGKMGTGGATSP